MERKYQNPPLIEAVCEFRVSEEAPWDDNVRELIYQELSETFPKKRSRPLQDIQVSLKRESTEQKIGKTDRVQYLNEDENRLVQIAPRMVSVNVLKPYPSWDQYKPLIEKTFHALQSAATIASIERIGLRYINKIEVPVEAINLNDYFLFTPQTGDNLPPSIESFFLLCVFPFNQGRDSGKVELKSAAPDQKGHSAVILDIDYYLSRPKTVETSQALNWVEEAHDKVEALFEGCITDKLRKLFEG